MKNQWLLSVLGILLIMTVRGDGYFPFPRDWPINYLLLIMLIHTVLFITLIVFASLPLIVNDRIIIDKPFINITNKFLVIYPVLAIFSTAVLHFIQYKRFQEFGYAFSWTSLAIFIAVGISIILMYRFFVFRNKSFKPIHFLCVIFISSLIFKLFPLCYFPVTAKRSDMLPVIYHAGNALINGENIYQYFLLDNGIFTQNVRLTGLILSFLPGVILDFDLRIINLFFETGVIVLLIYLLRKIEFQRIYESGVIIGICCFIFLPYWHFRHELYEVPFWLYLTITFILLNKDRFLLALIFLGILFGTHQWGWLFLPYFLIYMYHKWGWKKTLSGMPVIIITGILLLMICIQTDFADFYQHIFGTYGKVMENKSFYPMSMYFSAILVKLNLEFLLRPAQIVLQAILLLFCLRFGKSLNVLAGFMALSLTAMLIFNPVAWTYQYLLVVFLLILGGIFYLLEEKCKKD
jgi:hypothetical protein